MFFDNQVDEAVKAYEKVLEQDANDSATLLRLGQLYRRQGNFNQSRQSLQKLLQLNGNNIEAMYELAMADREDGQLEDSAKRFADILKRTEKSTGQYSQAELRNRRTFGMFLGLNYSALGRYDDAIRAFTELRAIATDKGSIDAYIVDTYRSAKNPDKAIEYAQTALKESPDSRELQILYAEALADKGRTDDGIKVLQKLTTGKDEDLDVFSTMASIYQRAKKFSDAQTVVDSAIKRFPDDERVYFIQGALYEKQNKVSDAEKAFRKSLELDENNPATLNYLGYMLADRSLKLDEALKLVQKAVDLDRGQGAYLDSLGWVYFRMNRLDLAEQYLKKAAAYVGTDSDIHSHLAELFLKQGRYDEARSAWTKSLQFAEDTEEAQKIRKKLDDIRGKTDRK
jgi:tetratricopeptide (TPR) repeat protein